jgi:two-component system response regulator NreC
LFNCIQEVQKGRFYITPYLAFYLEEMSRPVAPGATKLKLLTRRESEVLGYIAKGYTNEQIAAQLHVSYRTVVNHKSNIVEKLSMNGAHELLPFAIAMCHLL